MRILLSSEHAPWSRAELEREVAGVNGTRSTSPTQSIALRRGLVHLSGELVTPTRAARRMDELRL
jgi:hypothetical protein